MKKLHSLALCALVTPLLTFSAGSVLAQQSTDREMDRKSSSMQHDKSMQHNKGFMDSVPARGMHASHLMEATVKTTGGEAVGSVSDLIVDEDGQIVAIVVGVGGILGMGEKDVAIGWDDVQRSKMSSKAGTSTASDDSDDLELHIDMSREELRSAPEFERQE
ncbi:PRC-barrel domain-containing protein [Chromatocurvus halotolerans]|uniref:Sporulation protein YlmC with PRC-barrel domain n=1 Tax=Chromatocurvus halotolerans TaxID=1132028 RepID=A0A4R2KM08_9GAMM|nr:PRC-barrel domain-containing protein [Chromatocurvus halotolerans]TCO74464.1 sporulation protein YlmC with PRC-barrel domain [Chromatocurvus halotolerans]